jgi:hypothetical protein
LLALERVEKWKDLYGNSEKEREKKFLAAIKDHKKSFALETKKYAKKKRIDLDAGSSLELFNMAEMDVKSINPVASGEWRKNHINLDTGNKEGFVVVYEGMENGDAYTGQPLTVYFDHHSADSKRGSSATKYVYETLTKLGLLDTKDKALRQAVEYVTHEDNRSYPEEEKYYKDSPYTLLGLGRYIGFGKLYQFFKDGLSPTKRLTPKQLEKYGLTEAHETQKKVLEKTGPRYKELERDGFIVDSKDYGKILVDIGGKFNSQAGGFVGAKAMGARAYILWNPSTRSFMLSTARGTFPEKLLPQGRRLRETMWIKDQPGPLKIRLDEVIRTLAGRSFRMGSKMKEVLDKAEKAASSRTQARQEAKQAA